MRLTACLAACVANGPTASGNQLAFNHHQPSVPADRATRFTHAPFSLQADEPLPLNGLIAFAPHPNGSRHRLA
jgi:hypothetical protein